VDYIFGFGVSLFDSCQIHTKRTNGYITASATPEYYEFGHVFKNCRLTTTPGISGIYLGRPWFPYANTIFYECWEPESIHAKGWKEWSGREETCIYREYNCFGPGSDTTQRSDFSTQLDISHADRYVTDTILAASNFPSDLGYMVDTAELMLLYRRFEESGYSDRADTILYAGRDSYPAYPEADWSPEYHSTIYSVIQSNAVPFLDSSYSKLNITGMLWDGNSLDGFRLDSTVYVVELPEGQTDFPVFEVVGEGVSTSTENPSAIPGNATVTATAGDRATGTSYKVYISSDSAWWSTLIEYIVLDYEDTIWIETGKEHYYSGLPHDITSIKSVKVKTKFPGQRYSSEKPGQIPGDVAVTVFAPNQSDSTVYKITVGVSSIISSVNHQQPAVKVYCNGANQITLQSEESIAGAVNFSLFDLSGRIVFEQNEINIASGKTSVETGNTKVPEGIYIYHIHNNSFRQSGKIIKTKK
jgi:hypothetical protein